MVDRYIRAGYINTNSMKKAMLKVPREGFMESRYIDYAYYDQPFPIPGDGRQTISAPYMYPITYEPLLLRQGTKILEIGAGSGYGAALARELVGKEGLVIAVEINDRTFHFAKVNLEKNGYDDVIVIHGDGTLGYQDKAPYNAISITASSPSIPPPLKEQLASPGRLVAPVGGIGFTGQDLLLMEKDESGKISKRSMMKVQYVPLQGKHGWRRE